MKSNFLTIISSIVLITVIAGCGSSSSNNSIDENSTGSVLNNNSTNTTQTRFASIAMMDQVVMQDSTTNLEWVNGTSANAPITVPSGCLPMPPGLMEVDATNTATNHCDALSFASHEDWRVPTITEIQTFTVGMKDVGLTPFYANPACPRIVGFDETNTTLQTTNTHNTDPIGEINDWIELNAGVRCVRAIETPMM